MAFGLPGCRDRPISRDDFSRVFLARLASKLADPNVQRYCKVTPTLVLFPDPADAQVLEPGSVTPSIRTVLKNKDGNFEEALASCEGKALLLNFCTSSLEAYPKRLEDCAKIYDMNSLEQNVVPTSTTEAAQFLWMCMQHARPLTPVEPNMEQIIASMEQYRQALGRRGPWRVATNLPSSVLGEKLSPDVLNATLPELGHMVPYAGQRLYREESYTPAYEFGCGDYAVIDLDAMGAPKLDKYGRPYVRTVNGGAFEMTYNHTPAG